MWRTVTRAETKSWISWRRKKAFNTEGTECAEEERRRRKENNAVILRTWRKAGRVA
jgi:hypothetical protein